MKEAEVTILKEIAANSFNNFSFLIMEARDKIIESHYCRDEDIYIYMPKYIMDFIITKHFYVMPQNVTTFVGLKVFEGYENCIVVTHREAALRDIPVQKITIK